MEPGLVLATFVNLEGQIEHILDVGFTMLEDEPSLFHAQNARTGTKRLHRCNDVTLPYIRAFRWNEYEDKKFRLFQMSYSKV